MAPSVVDCAQTAAGTRTASANKQTPTIHAFRLLLICEPPGRNHHRKHVAPRRNFRVPNSMKGTGPHQESSSPPTNSTPGDRKSTRLNSSHGYISYAVFCLKTQNREPPPRRQVAHKGVPAVRNHDSHNV